MHDRINVGTNFSVSSWNGFSVLPSIKDIPGFEEVYSKIKSMTNSTHLYKILLKGTGSTGIDPKLAFSLWF